MTTIRLDDKTEKKIESIAEELEESKSFVVKEALAMYFTYYDTSTQPYEVGKHLFGKYGSGRSDLSTKRKQILKEKLRAKNSR